MAIKLQSNNIGNKMLEKLAVGLKVARLKQNETQKVFSLRLGVKVSTYRNMERGSEGVSIGSWAKAMAYLGWDEPLLDIVKPTPSLLERARLEYSAQGTRKRATAIKKAEP